MSVETAQGLICSNLSLHSTLVIPCSVVAYSRKFLLFALMTLRLNTHSWIIVCLAVSIAKRKT
jgi:hypothetical protein